MAEHGPDQAELDRLTADLRVMDANGIERAAWGWDRHERRGLDRYHEAERAALAAIEQHDGGPRWEEFRRRLFGLTEAKGALVNESFGPGWIFAILLVLVRLQWAPLESADHGAAADINSLIAGNATNRYAHQPPRSP